MSGVLVVLGAAAAKTAFKVWTGDNTLADNVTDELTDLLAGRVSDARDRHKVASRFARIAEIVGDRVAATLHDEFREVDPGEQNAAILAVAETLRRAELSDVNTASRPVFAASLDAATLERSVRRLTGTTTRDLSAAGTALYDVVLSQCCASIVEIADKLPRFQADAFATLLGNDRMIIDRIEEVLTRLPMPSPRAAGGDQVEVDYRRLIAKDFDRLQLFGLDFAAQWYPLSIAYVSLTMTAAGVDGLGDGERLFENWLRECPRLLIEGRAGGGKTTLLQWIAVRAALRDFPGAAGAFNDYVPFFLRLRGYVGRPLPKPDEFLDSAAAVLAPEAGGWPSAQLRGGKAFVLVDGLDEIPEAQRAEVITWLGQLTGAFPAARYVVTSRPGAVEAGALAGEGFVSADLEPMSPSLVQVFVDRWHTALRGLRQDTTARERLAACQAELRRTLDDDRFVSELANTPLLAGLICALNHHLDGELPRRRGEIYEEALKMFHKRDRKRKIAVDLELDLDATNHMLSDLALWMVRNAQTEVTAESPADGATVTAQTARAVLAQSALSLPSRPALDDDLYGHLLLRSGVLREPTAGHVDFVHRTFQEYLAAKALIRHDSVNELVRNAGDDQWREIIILASGLCATNQQARDLLRGLIKPGWRDKQRYRRRLLAVACLDEIRHADQSVLRQIEEAIPELLPPKDMSEAEALSHAGGDRLIPHLEAVIGRGDGAAKRNLTPMIRAAALTGGDKALRLLGQLASFTRTLPALHAGSATGEFIRAWSYFDPDIYAEQVIAPLKITDVTISDLRCIRGIRRAPMIRTLTIESLEADYLDIAAFDGLALDSVTVAGSSIEAVRGIEGVPSSIEHLVFRSCPRLRSDSVSSAFELSRLKSVDFIDCGAFNEPWKMVEGTTTPRAEPFALLTSLADRGRPLQVTIGYFALAGDIEFGGPAVTFHLLAQPKSQPSEIYTWGPGGGH